MSGKNTAIVRKGLSAPVRWLLRHNYLPLKKTFLDYGCGRGMDVSVLKVLGYDVDGYDPEWGPLNIRRKTYDIILCTYVLCILDPFEHNDVLDDMYEHVSSTGYVFVTVRRDLKQSMKLVGDHCQTLVSFACDPLYENKDFAIYSL